MPLSPAFVMMLASQCAPSVAADTLVSIVRVESAFDPLAIGVNRPVPSRLHPKSLPEAIDTASNLIASGANIDLGLGQINSANLLRLSMTVADAFQPCHNLRAAGDILERAYQSQLPAPGREQTALRAALSIYNTGRADRGFQNGYVAKVSAAAGLAVPALSGPSKSEPAPPPPWDVFAAARTSERLVFTSPPIGVAP